MDFEEGFQRENVKKGSLVYSVLARVDKETVEKLVPLPDFSTLDKAHSISFLDNLFKYKIEVENKKEIPEVGYPVDYLILTPQGISKESIRTLADFAI